MSPTRNRSRRLLRIAAWIGAAALLLVVVLGIGLAVLLHSGRVHQYLLRSARERVTAALGSEVQIGNFTIRLASLAPSLDLYDVVVAGAPPHPSPPLLRVDHVHVGIQITSLFRRTWYLSDVTVDHPVVWFLEDANGRTNLPRFGGNATGGTDVFDLGIRHAALQRGEIYVNQRPGQLQADLHGVMFQSVFDTARRRYSGSFRYAEGNLKYQHFRPIPHALAVSFAATPAGIEVSDLEWSSGNSRLRASGRMRGFVHPQISGTYQLALDATQARAIFFQPALPAGMISVNGTASYGALSGQSLLQSVNAEGSFASPGLAVAVAGLSTPVRALSGRFHLAQGNLDVTSVRAAMVGGQASATLAIRDLGGAAPAHLQAELRNSHLDQVARLAQHSATTLGQAGITGTVSGSADVHWDGAGDHWNVAANAALAAAIAPAGAGGAPIPLQGTVHAHYADDQLSLVQSSITTPQTELTASGTVGMGGHSRAALQVRLQSNDLHELETIGDRLQQALSDKPLVGLGLYGVGSFAGTVTGSIQAPHIAGEVAGANLRVRGSAWRSVGAALAVGPSQVEVSNGLAVGDSGARIRFTLGAGLDQWAFRDTSPIQASLDAAQVPLNEVARLLGRPLPVSGILAAKLTLHGSELNPIGEGSLSLLRAKVEAGPVEEPLQSATATFQGTGDAIQGTLSVSLPAGKLQATGTYYPKQQSYDAQVHADGIRVDRLQTVASRNLRMLGLASLDGSGRGTVVNPEFEATLTTPKIEFQGQPITALTLQASLANHRVHAVLDSKAVQTALHGDATVELSGNYAATAALDTQTIPIAPLLAVYAPAAAENITGQTEIHATLQGPLGDIRQAQARVELPVLRLNYGETYTLAAAAPVRLQLANGVLTLQPADLEGTNTRLQVAGTIPVQGPEAMKVQATGTVDLKIVQAFAPNLATTGRLQLNVKAGGSLSAPELSGEIQVAGGSLASDSLPVGIQNANGLLRLNGDRITIANLTASVGGGTLTGSGGVAFGEASASGGLQFSLGLAARQVRLLYPPNVRDALSADLTLTGTPESAFLNGRVQIESVSVTPQFDLANFVSQVSGGGTAIAAPGSFTQNLALNVAISTPNQINTVSRDFSLQGSANLTLRGTAAEPVLLGRLNVTSGDLIFRGNRYVVQGGTLDFVNPSQTQPVVNLTADTSIQQYNLHLHFEGPANNLHTAYTSDPALPPADIINLLAFGQTNEASAANPTPGNLGAENLIASAVSSQITDRVQKIAGISQLSVDPVLGGNQQNAGARITIQQRVTGNLFVTISSDVTSTQRDVIEIQYKLSPRVAVSAVRDQNGGIGLNASFKKSW